MTLPNPDRLPAGMSPYVQGVRRILGHALLLLPSVTVLPLDDQRRILLVQSVGTERWDTVGGPIEPDESGDRPAQSEHGNSEGTDNGPIRVGEHARNATAVKVRGPLVRMRSCGHCTVLVALRSVSRAARHQRPLTFDVFAVGAGHDGANNRPGPRSNAANGCLGRDTLSEVVQRGGLQRPSGRPGRHLSNRSTHTEPGRRPGQAERNCGWECRCTLIAAKRSDLDGYVPEGGACRQPAFVDASGEFLGTGRPQVRVDAHL